VRTLPGGNPSGKGFNKNKGNKKGGMAMEKIEMAQLEKLLAEVEELRRMVQELRGEIEKIKGMTSEPPQITLVDGENTQGQGRKKVVVTMPYPHDVRFKAWAKILRGIDRTKTDGYAFLGEFISLSGGKRGEVRHELEVGTLIMMYNEEGSMKYHKPSITVWEVQEDGSLEEIYYHPCKGYSWALEVRDDLYEFLRAREEEKKKNRNEAEA
jgi:hypothetical protein